MLPRQKMLPQCGLIALPLTLTLTYILKCDNEDHNKQQILTKLQIRDGADWCLTIHQFTQRPTRIHCSSRWCRHKS